MKIGEALNVSERQISRDIGNSDIRSESKHAKTSTNPKGAGLHAWHRERGTRDGWCVISDRTATDSGQGAKRIQPPRAASTAMPPGSLDPMLDAPCSEGTGC
jgi:hypothetical protein